mmetsp:Transcript_26015/g.42078  ORF Transcript_26015/g.42078 Transcript_26015/m.42078 type:complete len:83 (-) Transcript_26015:93-341(-)
MMVGREEEEEEQQQHQEEEEERSLSQRFRFFDVMATTSAPNPRFNSVLKKCKSLKSLLNTWTRRSMQTCLINFLISSWFVKS